jgi:hypothetical protein
VYGLSRRSFRVTEERHRNLSTFRSTAAESAMPLCQRWDLRGTRTCEPCRGAVRASSSRCLVASRTPFGVRFGWRRPPRGHDTPQPNLQCHRTDWIRRQRPRRPLSHDLISLSLRLALLDSPDSAARKERRKPTCLALSSLRRHHIR